LKARRRCHEEAPSGHKRVSDVLGEENPANIRSNLRGIEQTTTSKGTALHAFVDTMQNMERTMVDDGAAVLILVRFIFPFHLSKKSVRDLVAEKD
jgi:hypothetical protein